MKKLSKTICSYTLIFIFTFLVKLSSGRNQNFNTQDSFWNSIEVNQVNKNIMGMEGRMVWWKDAKFGMFIHWGLYSQLAGEWNGEVMKGHTYAEQINLIMKIPNAEYEKTAKLFNPIKFDAKEWVELAKRAGMKYMVVTAKHQDGFSMFKTGYSDYNIVNATPFKRDPIKELSEECRNAGIKFGIYYSHARDYHEAGANWNTYGNTWDFPPQTQDSFETYFYDKVFYQVRELLTNYGDISLMWFDVPYKLTEQMSRDLRTLVLSLQPDCIINSRIGNLMGDFECLPDNQLANKTIDSAWETCATMNETWGYSKHDHQWKSVKTLLYNFVDVVSKGGNYLLNVGPTGEGLIPKPSIERLREMGNWLKVNREAIYKIKTMNNNHQGDSIMFTMSRDEKSIYAITFHWPGTSITLENIEMFKTSKVYLIGYNKSLDWNDNGNCGIQIQIPVELQKKESRPCDHAWTFRIDI